jgi:hypothetical protein
MSPDRWWRQSRNQKRPHRWYECLGITNRPPAAQGGRDNALISGPCHITRQAAHREEIPNRSARARTRDPTCWSTTGWL